MKTKRTRQMYLRTRLIEWDKENPRQLVRLAERLGVSGQYLSAFKAGGTLAEKYFDELEAALSEGIEPKPDMPPNQGTPVWLIARELRDCADWLEMPQIDPVIKFEKLKALISRYVAALEAFEHLIKEGK